MHGAASRQPAHLGELGLQMLLAQDVNVLVHDLQHAYVAITLGVDLAAKNCFPPRAPHLAGEAIAVEVHHHALFAFDLLEKLPLIL